MMEGDPWMELNPGVSRRPWGGRRLERLYNLSPSESGESVGETWNVSVHPDSPSTWQGRPLSEWVPEQKIPYLVKLIDTADSLSVQVHPDDHFAKTFENERGKSECWLILDAGKDGGIHLGLREGISREDFVTSLNEGRDVSSLLNFVKVSRGDFFYVPAGTLHSIGKDVFLAEVQQSSGITYRVWDWGRGRELHLDKALKVAHFDRERNCDSYFQVKHDLFSTQSPINLVRHSCFCVTLYNLRRGETCSLVLGENERFPSLLILEGEGVLGNSLKKVDVRPYQSYLLREDVVIESASSLSFIFVS